MPGQELVNVEAYRDVPRNQSVTSEAAVPPTPAQVTIDPDLRGVLKERLVSLYREHFRPIGPKPELLERWADDTLDAERSAAQLRLFEELGGVSLHGRRLLEIGAGVGMTVATARLRFGAEAVGIEPGEDEYSGSLAVAAQLHDALGLPRGLVRCGVGEALPFPDATFDAVYSSNVLEHTQDPETVVREAVRVLKPGGCLQFVVPNYGSWWEGHYGILWIPNMPRWMARLYLRVRGRSTDYLETLQLINRRWLGRMVRRLPAPVEVLDWGVELWQNRVRTLQFAEYSSLGRLKRLVRWLHRLGLVHAVLWLGRRLHWETPLVLTLRRTPEDTALSPSGTAAKDNRT